ncbi:malate dehydrogenase, mitochondrial-like [Cimex lectularius]|uniref:Malate dehydrogenase, mitochondrial n=1 Tax=Cimex lectularius TaxID=79782 RepID=A0A8I6TGX6_CIMLE|nr:malate dehydrogenase, mitochondrial-like [Cimex lectularius]
MHSLVNFFKKGTSVQPNNNTTEQIATAVEGLKVALLGSMNNIGQPLSLLLKRTNLFDEIALHDEMDTKDQAEQLLSVDLPGKVTSHRGKEGIKSAIKDANIVLVVGGKVYHPDISKFSRDEVYNNCKYVYECSKNCVAHSPFAITCVSTGPLTTTFTVASEVFKAAHRNFHYKVIGVNNFLSIKADLALGSSLRTKNMQVIPVIGGCTPKTSVPLISCVTAKSTLSTQSSIFLTQKYQRPSVLDIASSENRDVSSMTQAFGVCQFASSLAKTISSKQPGFIENAFVMTKDTYDIPCFGLPVMFGKFGIKSMYDLPSKMHFYEAGLLKIIKPTVAKEVKEGQEIYKQIVEGIEEKKTFIE